MSTTLARLRRDVGEQIGDVLIGTATASGGPNSFIDNVTFVQGAQTLAGRQAIMVSGAANNLNVLRVVTGNDPATGRIDVRPPFATNPSAGNVIELYSARGGGPLVPEITRAINRAIRDAAEDNLVEVTSSPVTYDRTAPTLTIPDTWVGFIDAEVEHEETGTWRSVHWRDLDRAARTVVVGHRHQGLDALDGRQVQLRGYTVPAELTSDDATTDINPEWLVNRASYHALIACAKKQTPTEANLSLGMAQAFREEANVTQSLARPRLRAFIRLGA